jgi:hypothetical protein
LISRDLPVGGKGISLGWKSNKRYSVIEKATNSRFQDIQEPEGILLHGVVVEHDIGWFFTDLLSEYLKFLVRIGVDIVRDAVKSEIVKVPKERVVLERIDAVNQTKLFTKPPDQIMRPCSAGFPCKDTRP